MIYEIKNTHNIQDFFMNNTETMITSCLQGVMGHIYGDDPIYPKSIVAIIGDLVFLAGIPHQELLLFALQKNFMIFVPIEKKWNVLIESTFPHFCKRMRYATKKDNTFSTHHLEKMISQLPSSYSLYAIDQQLFDYCQNHQWCHDFVSQFGCYEDYERMGIGYMILKNNQPVCGASSYTCYLQGIEIQIDTHADYRQRGLASVCAAKLILECLKKGKYPSWDAQNVISLHLAEKLGYIFDYEYEVYEITKEI